LTVEVISDLGAITVFTELLAHIGRGEAACIAIAEKEGWHIASDEKRRFLREAEARVGVGHIITTVDVFVLAINAGRLTVEEADADKFMLEGRRFKVSFRSYRELVK
jgi:predicted nucleic acid-binding protein